MINMLVNHLLQVPAPVFRFQAGPEIACTHFKIWFAVNYIGADIRELLLKFCLGVISLLPVGAGKYLYPVTVDCFSLHQYRANLY